MPQKPDNPHHEHGVVVAPSRPQTARPPLYSVLLLNDDYTPMDFVIDVLMRFFPLNLENATQIMLHVHTRGRGVCVLGQFGFLSSAQDFARRNFGGEGRPCTCGR